MAISKIKAVFQSDIQTVWDVVTSLINYQWRSDLSRIDIMIMKPFVKSFLKKQQEQYVSDLRKALL